MEASENRVSVPWPPANVRKGFWRIYGVAALAWLAIFGYIAADAHSDAVRFQDEANMWNQPAMSRSLPNESIANAGYAVSVHFREASRQHRNKALMMLPLLPIGVPMVWLGFLGLVAAVRKTS